MKDSWQALLGKLPHAFFAGITMLSTIGLVYALINHECSLEAAQAVSDTARVGVSKANSSTWLATLVTDLMSTGPSVWIVVLIMSISAWAAYAYLINLMFNPLEGTFSPVMRANSRLGVIGGLIMCVCGSALYTFAPDMMGSQSDCSWSEGLLRYAGALLGVGGLIWTTVSGCRLAAHTILYDDSGKMRTNAHKLFRFLAYGVVALTAAILAWVAVTTNMKADSMTWIGLGVLFVIGTWLFVRPKSAAKQ